MQAGMFQEVARLHQNGVSYRRLEKFGLEYRNCALFLQNKISEEQLIKNLKSEIWQYVKRQRTWFRHNPPSLEKAMARQRITWLNPLKKSDTIKAEKLINNFLKTNA